jgi:hypothetical protein
MLSQPTDHHYFYLTVRRQVFIMSSVQNRNNRPIMKLQGNVRDHRSVSYRLFLTTMYNYEVNIIPTSYLIFE